MIIEAFVKIKLNARNIKRFVDLGYHIPKNSKFKDCKYGFKVGQEIEVKVSDLSPGSKVIVTHKCDKCGIERPYEYRYTKDLICKSCANTGKLNGMYGKRVKRTISGVLILPKYTESERKLRKLERSVLYSSYRKIYDVLKGVRRKSDILKYLGCSVKEFKLYIENQFKPGMTWDNWSKTGWHLDHIIPLNKLDPTNLEDFKKACHYTNFQPMWATNNCAKGDTLPTVYVLTGCFGSGKSWVANQLEAQFHVYDYDKKKYKDSDFTNPIDFTKPILYVLPIKVSTFIKRMGDRLNIKLITIIEEREVIMKRLQGRSSKLINDKTIHSRIKRMDSFSKKSIFSGTSNQVLHFLLKTK